MKFVYVADDVLSEKECERIIKFFEINGGRHEPGVTIARDDPTPIKKSTDWCKHFGEEDAVDLLLQDKLIDHTEEYHRFVKGINHVSSTWDVDPNYNIQKYDPGEGYYVWHHEHGGFKYFPKLRTVRRILAWMIYLNDVPNGGTEFLDQGQTVEAKRGRLLIWPAYWTHTHRSQVSNTQVKYIATGWYNFDVPEIE